MAGGVYGTDGDEVVCVRLELCEQYAALGPGQHHKAYVTTWDWPILHPVLLDLSQLNRRPAHTQPVHAGFRHHHRRRTQHDYTTERATQQQ